MKSWITALAMVLTASVANATPANVEGVGSSTCGAFSERVRQAPAQAELAYFSWAEGFLTGLNLLRFTQKEPERDLAAMPIDKQMAYLRSYCNAHPLTNFRDGVVELFMSLPIYVPTH